MSLDRPIDEQDEILTLTRRTVYKNKWMTVKENTVQRRSGEQGIYGVVEKPDFVVVVPVEDGHIHLVEQYRYPVGLRCWELPQGSWECSPKADPVRVAAGELREETGLSAGRIEHVGHLFLANGYSNQGYHVYFATNFTQGATELDAEEEGLVSCAFSLSAFEQMLTEGTIKDATSLAAFSLAKLKGFV